MNPLFQFIPLLIGGLAVVQAGLNRKIAQTWGLPTAVLINSAVLLLAAIALFIIGLNSKSEFLEVHFAKAQWWYIIPGLIGFCFVFGVPWSIHHWGAVHTFVLLVSGQLMFSLFWDSQIENLPLSWMRIAGCLLAWLGVGLTTMAK